MRPHQILEAAVASLLLTLAWTHIANRVPDSNARYIAMGFGFLTMVFLWLFSREKV